MILKALVLTFGAAMMMTHGAHATTQTADAPPAATTATVGAPAPDFTLEDSNGNSVTLSGLKGKTVVLEWTNHDCPFVRKFYDTNTMQTMQKDAVDAGVIWLTVASSAEGKQGYTTAKDANEIIKKEKSNETARLLDPSGTVGKAYGAATTPHMFVIDPAGTLVYAGGIDDQPSVSHASLENANNYVKLALADLAAGGKVKTPTSKPYGCAVKY